MTSTSGQDPSRSAGASARRSKRVNLAIPIVLSGTDQSGNKFQETTRTIVVNKHGAKIKTTNELAVGTLVTIENRSLGLAAKAVVVSIGNRQYPGEPVETGVQLTQAGNVWGIIFPPDDWEGGPLQGLEGGELDLESTPPESTAGDTLPPAAATGSAPSTAGPSGPDSGPDALSSLPAESVRPRAATASGPPREKIDAITAAVAAKLSKQLDEVAGAHLKGYAEKVIRFTNQFALRVQANFQDAANRTEDQMVVLIQQKLGALADRVQISRNALESLLARFEALQKNSKSLIEDTEQGIREAGQVGLESAVQELNGRLRKGFDGTSAAMEAECQERIRAAAAKTVNTTLAQAGEQLAALAQDRLVRSAAELKWQQERLIDGVKEQLNQIALSGTTSLTAKIEAIGEEIIPSMREGMEKSLQESAGKVVAQTTQSLQGQSQVLIQDALVSLQQAVQSLQDRMQEEGRKVRQSTEQDIGKVAEAFNANVTERSEMAIGSVHSAAEQGTSKLKAAQLESVRSLRATSEDFHRQLATRSGMTLEGFQTGMQNLTREMQESAAQVFAQKLQFAADELTEASAEKLRLRIQEEAVAATEVFSTDAKKRLAMLSDQFLASSSQELQGRLRSQAEAHLESVAQSASDKLSDHLRKLTQEAGITLAAESQKELQKISSALLGASAESLRDEVGQLTSKLRDDLKAFQAAFADQSRKQLLAMARSTVGTLNQEAVTGLEQFRARLHTAAQESRQESLRTLESSFQEVLEKQRAAISASIQQQAEQSRELAGLQIKTVGEQVVANAMEALDRQAGKSTRMIADSGEQTRASLENQIQKIEMEAKKSLWEYQRQMEQSTSSSLDKFRKDTGTLLDEVVFRLQQSVRSFQSATADEVLGELQKASNNLLEVSAAQMRKQTEQSLDLITERLKQKEEEVVSDVVNVFRSRIAEIFTILQEGPKTTAKLPDPERVKEEV